MAAVQAAGPFACAAAIRTSMPLMASARDPPVCSRTAFLERLDPGPRGREQRASGRKRGDRAVTQVVSATQTAYLAFTAGYAPGSGPDLLRADLAGEAIRLVRVVMDLCPGAPAPTALLALMLLQHSRRDARVGDDGRLVLLADQDRRRWRRDEIDEAQTLLAAHVLAGPVSPLAASYILQARNAAAHATSASPEETRWDRIVEHYDLLVRLFPSPAPGSPERSRSPRRPVPRPASPRSTGSRSPAATASPPSARNCWPGAATPPQPGAPTTTRSRRAATTPNAHTCSNGSRLSLASARRDYPHRRGAGDEPGLHGACAAW